MQFLWVGVAGAVGAVFRYAIGLSIDQSRFPWATLGINLSGALLLGFFLAAALSTFMWEAFTLGRGGRSEVAVVYVAVSVCGGLLAAWAGFSAGRALH